MAKFDPSQFDGRILKVCAYHPYRLPDGTVNPAVDQNSRHIMDLKDSSNRNYAAAIEDFGTRFRNALLKIFDFGATVQLAIVPSSQAGCRSQALEAIVGYLDGYLNVIYRQEFLIRKKTIRRLHEGGDRSLQNHINTIEVGEVPDSEIPVVILDDVTTTGNSLEACEFLLKQAGAGIVIMFAIGKTA